MEAVADREAPALRLVEAGAHAFMGDEEIMKPSRPREAKLVARIEDRGLVAQEAACVIKRDGLKEGLGRQTGPAGEDTLQMMRRETRFGGNRLERWLLAPVLGDEGQRLLD